MKSKIVMVVAVLAGLALIVPQLQAGEGVTVQQALSMSEQGVLLLDVREADEYAAGHAPNAKLLPLSVLATRIGELDAYKDKPIAVMCRSGRRSANAVGMLQQAGFTQASNVQGGIIAWQQAGQTVVR